MSENVETPITTHDDGRYVRTAIRMDPRQAGSESNYAEGASLDVLDSQGSRIAQINLFGTTDGSWFAVDVIDVDDRFGNRRVLAFNDGKRRDLDCGSVGAVDFRSESAR